MVLAARGISRPPEAESAQVSAKDLKSPIDFKIKFVPHGELTIDPALTRVTYLKDPLIDLTPRLTRYIKASGIDMPDAELPPGKHLIRIELTDSNHHTGSSVLTLVVGR